MRAHPQGASTVVVANEDGLRAFGSQVMLPAIGITRLAMMLRRSSPGSNVRICRMAIVRIPLVVWEPYRDTVTQRHVGRAARMPPLHRDRTAAHPP